MVEEKEGDNKDEGKLAFNVKTKTPTTHVSRESRSRKIREDEIVRSEKEK